MWRRRLSMVAVALALSIGSLPSQASAQTLCGKRLDLLFQLAQRFGEVPNAIGITDQGALLDLVVAPTGTWTMMLTVPGGATCVVATGQHWETLPATVEQPGA